MARKHTHSVSTILATTSGIIVVLIAELQSPLSIPTPGRMSLRSQTLE